MDSSTDLIAALFCLDRSHNPQNTIDIKDYGAYDASEDELPPINNAAGGRGNVTNSKTSKYNNNKTSESSKGGLTNGGSTNRSTYQDVKSRKNVANVALKKGIPSVALKKGIPSARAKKTLGSSAYSDVSGRLQLQR